MRSSTYGQNLSAIGILLAFWGYQPFGMATERIDSSNLDRGQRPLERCLLPRRLAPSLHSKGW